MRAVVAGVALVAWAVGPGARAAADEGPASRIVYRTQVRSTINPGALTQIGHAIGVAERAQGEALVIELDTPGGLVSTTRDIVSAISRSRVPVVVYVTPAGSAATSAGSFILMASHVSVMDEGTNVGAASPISGSGEDIGGTLGKKIMSDTRAFMRSTAEARGRNAALAERFVSEALSLTASEARRLQVVDLVIPGPQALLASLHGMEVELRGKTRKLDTEGSHLVDIAPRAMDLLLSHLAHPQIAYLLTTLGSLGIFVEILSPGLLFPGIFGVISLILGLVCLQTLPVEVGFLLLLLLGLGLMFAEVFVEGFGVLGIGGLVAFVLGSLNLFDEPSTVEYRWTVLTLSLGIGAAFLLLTLLVARGVLFPSGRRRLAGRAGEAMVAFQDEGYVLVGEESMRAQTVEPLEKGDAVTVLETLPKGKVRVKKRQKW